MGTNRDLTATQLTRQAEEMAAAGAGQQRSQADAPREYRDARYKHRFEVSGPPRVLVSAITSLYRGGAFIEQFMDNITSQEGFRDYCELVIVDADSPEGEYDTIKRYMAEFPNINYIRINHRIGIYDAWNVAAQAAKGEYLTNANLDDLRRADSFMLQAGTLESLPFVDIAYQDLDYTFDPRLPFEEIARFGHQTALPVITLHNMVQYNSPHNAPMWRKSLHDELGYFDINFKSAGDYEFWFRCLAAGKVFYKINDPHVAYYQNPKGLSTRPDSRGLMEALEVHKRYCRKLTPEEVVMPSEAFLRRLRPSGNGEMRRDRYRYAMAQDALRTVARTRKFAGAGA
jgi:glycosyltransferase involved in cell wall biosynthesis